MFIIKVLSIVVGIIMWNVPKFKFPTRHKYLYRAVPRKNTLMGRRKQVIAGSSVALGIVGIITNMNEIAFLIAALVLWTVAVVIADVGPHKPSRSGRREARRQREFMTELRETENMIYAFLSQPENAAIRRQVMARPTESLVGQALIQKMKAQAPDDPRYRTLRYHQDFYDCLQGAVRRLKQDEQSRPAPPGPTGPMQAFDVVLTDAGPSSIRAVMAVKQITKLGLHETQHLVNSVPTTILTGVSQDEAELARDVLLDLGATVELAAAETKE